MKFSDIPGHEAEKAQLRQLVDADRIPHALLLSGPPGIGKLALARALAQYIHCTSRTDGDSCGECQSCRLHRSHNNADMYYVFPVLKRDGLSCSDEYMGKWRVFLDESKYASFGRWLQLLDAGNSQPSIFVDEATEIIRKLSLSNYSAKYKIMLIWLPERLREATANKLLKIIEEPWADTKFIFVSNEPQAILPTVFSRTQRVNLRRPDDATVAAAVERECGLEPPDAAEVARMAEGNLNTAFEMVSAQDETEEFRGLFQELMRMAYRRDAKAMKESADRTAGMGREKIRRMLTYFSRQIRENLIYNLHRPQLNVMTRQEERFSSNFAPFINAENAVDVMRLIDTAASDIERNANAKMVLFDTFLSLIICVRRR